MTYAILLFMVAINKNNGTNWNGHEDPVGVNEIANLLNVETTTVSSWRQRHVMPKPDKMINKGKTPIWKTSTIIDWANATGRNRNNLAINEDNNIISEQDELESFTVADLQWDG